MSDFHFLRPEFLLLIPLVLIIAALISQSSSANNWAEYISTAKLKLLIKGQGASRKTYSLVYALAGILLSIAIAGPTWEQRPVPTRENISALVILLDLSPSMMAEDIQPNRLTRARLKITDLLRNREDGQTALIAYSGSAHRVSPLTDDTNTIEALLPALSPEIMPESGSNIEAAVELAMELLSSAGFENNGHLLLVTDGVAPEAQKNIGDMLPVGIKVSILGVGSTQGAPIPLGSGNFFRDSRGDIVLAQLNRNELQILAGLSSGRYIELQPDDSDLNYLLAHIDQPQAAAENTTDTNYDAWNDLGYLIIILILPFALMAFRRDFLFALPFLIVLSTPSEKAHADFWQDLWLTPDQQAQRLLEEGDAAAAAEKFESPEWKAYAAYEAEQFNDAVSGQSSLYNQGTSLAKAGEYEEALEALNQFIEENPDHTNALQNREIVELLLEQQEQEQQQNQQGENSEQQEGSEGQQDQNAQQNQQGDENDQSQQSDSAQQQSQQGQDQNAEEQELADGNGQEQSEEQSLEEAQQSGEQDENEASEEGQQLAQLIDTPEELSPTSEQFLRGIPDDPSGLLRRKFEYESRLYEQQRRFVPPTVPGQSEEERYQ